MLYRGISNVGGIDVMEKDLYKLVPDMSFQIIIKLILGLIFGIIVDTFAQLRDCKAIEDDDRKNRCYICNFEREVFDNNTEGGFVRHIKHDHNLWNYIYYIVHLNAKDSSDYNSIESYVMDMLSEDDISWVPKKALCLENNQDHD